MIYHQRFKKLFGASELDVNNLNEKELKKLGITKHEFVDNEGNKIVYYLFFGTNKMLFDLPYAS